MNRNHTLKFTIISILGVILTISITETPAKAQQSGLDKFFTTRGNSSRAIILLESGENAFELGDYQLAKERLETLTKLFPEFKLNFRAYEILARIAEEQNDFKRADSLLKLVSKTAPRWISVVSLRKRVNIAFQEKDYPKAISLLKEYISKEVNPDRRNVASLLLSKLYVMVNKPDSALHVLTKESLETRTGGIVLFVNKMFNKSINVLDEFDDDTSHFVKGLALYELKEYDRALSEFLKVSNRVDFSDWANYYAGRIYMIQGDYDIAVEYFKKVRKSDLVPLAQFGIALAEIKTWDYESATEILKKVSDVSYLAAHANLLLGQLVMDTGDYAGALEKFKRAEISATSGLKPLIKLKKAETLIQLKKYNTALEELNTLEISSLQPDSIRYRALLAKIEALVGLKRYDDAEAILKDVVNTPQPWDSYFQFESGVIFYLKGNDSLVIERLRPLVSNPTLGDYAKLYLGDAAFNLRMFYLASKMYSSILRESKNRDVIAEALWGLGLTDYRLRQYRLAAENFNTFIQKFPQHPLTTVAIYLIASSYEQMGEWERAVNMLNDLRLEGPSPVKPRVTFDLANLYYNHRDYWEALSTYRSLIEDYPGSDLVDEAIEGIFWSAQKTGTPGKLKEILSEIVQKHPGLRPLISLKEAEFWFNIGKDTATIRILTDWVSQYSGNPLQEKAYLLLAQAYERSGDLEKAVENYMKVSGSALASFKVGKIFYSLKEYNAAKLSLERFLEKFNRSEFVPEAMYILGNCLEELNLPDSALAMYRKVRRIKPDSRLSDMSAIRIAIIQSDSRDWQKYLNLLDSVVKNRTDDVAAEALLTKGKILIKHKKFGKAVLPLLEVSKVYESIPKLASEALFLAGKSYEKMNRLKEAVVVYKRLMKKYPDSVYFSDASKRVKKLEGLLLKGGGSP